MKKLFAILILLLSQHQIFAQEVKANDKDVDLLLDELFQEDAIVNDLIATLSTYKFLYLGINYNSAAYFSGRDIGIDQYTLTPQISYIHSNGFFASLSGIYYSEFEPKWDVTMTTIGFGKSIGASKKANLYVAYSKYFYGNDFENSFTNSLSAGLSVRNKKRTLGAQLSGSFLFGEDQSYQINLYGFASVPILKTNKSSLHFRPRLSFITGKQTIELARSTVIDDQPVTDYIENDVFDLINTQLSLPLQFSTMSFDFEVGYNVNFPNALGSEENLETTGYFNFSIAHMINL